MSRIEMYTFSMMCKKGEYTQDKLSLAPTGYPDKAIRVRKILTSVTEPGVAIITGLYVSNVNQIFGELDAWELSSTYQAKLRTAFLTEHGLLGKSASEIDDYLEENDLSMADVVRLEIPTISATEHVAVTGRFAQPFVITFIGAAVRS